jgi:acetyl esterase
MLDPDIRRLLDTVFKPPETPIPPDVATLRAAAEKAPELLGGAPCPVDDVHDVLVPATTRSLPVRVYRPRTPSPPPVIVYAHGGGWVTGSLASHDRLCRLLALRIGAVVVSVDYACAPENVYPAALDDVAEAWHWVRANASQIGGDGERFAVAGDSSGGNLAAALTLRLRADGAPQPDLQLLLYPALDANCSRPSYREFDQGYNLSAALMTWYWNAYRAGADPAAIELSPLTCPRLDSLAPAVIAVAEFDVLRDDALAYADGIKQAGGKVQLIVCEGMIHGFLRWTGAVSAAMHWIDAIAAAARTQLRIV